MFKLSISSRAVLLLLLAMLCLEIVSLFSWAVRTCVSRNASLVGIKCTVVETQRAEHAKEIVTGLSLSELQSFDGFVAVRSSHALHLMRSSGYSPAVLEADRAWCA